MLAITSEKWNYGSAFWGVPENYRPDLKSYRIYLMLFITLQFYPKDFYIYLIKTSCERS
jgi:hypothetical protein